MESRARNREALQENARERVPLLSATTQTNLGNALARLGERESENKKTAKASSRLKSGV